MLRATGRGSSAEASSTSLPVFITATRSHIWRTTARSWLMSRSVETGRVAQILEEVQDLRLHRDVERRGRLVADDSSDVRRAPARSTAAGAVRPKMRAGYRLGRSHRVPRPRCSCATSSRSLGRRRKAIEQDRLGQDRADTHAAVERRIRILENHLDRLPQGPTRR